MRSRSLLGTAVVAILALTACGDDTDPAAPTEPNNGNGAEAPSQPDLAPPPDGVAAVVDDHQIPEEQVQTAYERIAEVPEVAEQLEGDQGDQMRQTLQAQVLTRLITTEIVVTAASEQFGIEASEDEVNERRDELANELGGEQALADELDAAGLTEDQLLEQELPIMIIIDELPDALGVSDEPDQDGGEDDGEGSGEGSGAPEADPAQAAIQQWVLQQLTSAEVSIDEDYGTWDPQTGQVQPPVTRRSSSACPPCAVRACPHQPGSRSPRSRR